MILLAGRALAQVRASRRLRVWTTAVCPAPSTKSSFRHSARAASSSGTVRRGTSGASRSTRQGCESTPPKRGGHQQPAPRLDRDTGSGGKHTGRLPDEIPPQALVDWVEQLPLDQGYLLCRQDRCPLVL